MKLDKDTLDETPGQRIKNVRKKLGMSQRQFAQLLGVTQVSVATWETDKKTPSQMAQRFIDLIGTLRPSMLWITLNR